MAHLSPSPPSAPSKRLTIKAVERTHGDTPSSLRSSDPQSGPLQLIESRMPRVRRFFSEKSRPVQRLPSREKTTLTPFPPRKHSWPHQRNFNKCRAKPSVASINPTLLSQFLATSKPSTPHPHPLPHPVSPFLRRTKGRRGQCTIKMRATSIETLFLREKSKTGRNNERNNHARQRESETIPGKG